MPRLPSKDDFGARALPEATRQVVGIRPDQTGRAVAALGRDVSQIAGKMEEREDSLNYARARSYFLTEKTKLERELDDDPEFEGWNSKYETRIREIQDAAGKMISKSRDRKAFDLNTAPDIQRGIGVIEDRQRGKRREVGLADLDTTEVRNINALLNAGDEETRKGLLNATNEAWDGAVKRGWVPPLLAAQKKREFARRYALVLGDDMKDRDPEQLLRILGAGGGASGDYAAKVQKFESGGKADAVNPDTNATGLYQFIDSTWLSQVAKHAPDAVAGKSRDQILALRSDPEVAKRVFDGFTKDNEVALAAAGVPVNDMARYMAHWFGAGGAAQILKADPNTPIAQFLPTSKSPTGKSWAAANGIEGKTVGEVIAIADKRMGGGGNVQVASLGGTATDASGTPQKTGTFVDLLDMPTRMKLQREAAAAWERQQAAGRVEREAREVQQTTESLFSRYGYSATGEAKALAEIRKNSEGKRQNDLVTAYRGRAEESRRLERQADDDLFESAYDLVWQGKANEITPDVRARLEQKGQWDKIGKEIEAQQSGNQQSTNWLWLHENYLSKTPAERMKVPLATIKDYTSGGDYKKIVEERKKVTEDDPGERDISTYINQRLKGIGIKGKTEEELKKVDLFHKELEARAAAWQAKNGQKMPNQEKRKLVDELTGKIAIDRPGWFNIDIDAPLFKLTDPNSTEAKRISKDTGIPADQLPLILRKASEYGIKPTMDNLRQIFEEGTQ